jgi:hypothetical protein
MNRHTSHNDEIRRRCGQATTMLASKPIKLQIRPSNAYPGKSAVVLTVKGYSGKFPGEADLKDAFTVDARADTAY